MVAKLHPAIVGSNSVSAAFDPPDGPPPRIRSPLGVDGARAGTGRGRHSGRPARVITSSPRTSNPNAPTRMFRVEGGGFRV